MPERENLGAVRTALSEVASVCSGSSIVSFFDLQFQDSVYKYLASGDGISSLEADRLREACQSLIGHLDDGQGDQVQGPDVSQVNLPGVISACACEYRQILSWEEIKCLSSFILPCIIAQDWIEG